MKQELNYIKSTTGNTSVHLFSLSGIGYLLKFAFQGHFYVTSLSTTEGVVLNLPGGSIKLAISDRQSFKKRQGNRLVREPMHLK